MVDTFQPFSPRPEKHLIYSEPSRRPLIVSHTLLLLNKDQFISRFQSYGERYWVKYKGSVGVTFVGSLSSLYFIVGRVV